MTREQMSDIPVGKRPRRPLQLTPDERSQLEIWRDGPPGPSSVRAIRARVILACAELTDTKEIATLCNVSRWTVYDWRTAFLQKRLESFLKFMK